MRKNVVAMPGGPPETPPSPNVLVSAFGAHNGGRESVTRFSDLPIPRFRQSDKNPGAVRTRSQKGVFLPSNLPDGMPIP